MICPNCNVAVSFKKDYCDNCGQDLVIYRKIISVSNMYYNDGLARAKVRDLSGAVISLKKSLEFNKKNTQARNLLGLVYYETGEIVSALSEWVISKYFQSDKNDADLYIEAIQANPNKLETVNQTIKKYNQALASAKQGDEDMAIIQLKKVVSISPNFVRAHQLLALLYMMTADREEHNRERAAKCLQKILRVDVTNTVTLKYMKELGISPTPARKAEPEREREEVPRRKTLPRDETAAFTPIANSYKEDKPSVLPFINVIVGIIIGLAVSYFLILPQAQSRLQKENSDQFKDYSETLAESNSQVTTLSNENEQLKSQLEELQQEVDNLSGDDPVTISAYEELYTTFCDAVKLYMDGKQTEAAEMLTEVKKSDFTSPSAKEIYTTITAATYEDMSAEYAEKGRVEYNQQCTQSSPDFTKAKKYLDKALRYNSDNCDAMYFLGRVSQREGDVEAAKEYYNTIINDYPDHARATEAASRLREIGG